MDSPCVLAKEGVVASGNVFEAWPSPPPRRGNPALGTLRSLPVRGEGFMGVARTLAHQGRLAPVAARGDGRRRSERLP